MDIGKMDATICYAKGFIQTSNKIIIGVLIDKLVSTYNGAQYNVDILIQKSRIGSTVDPNGSGHFPDEGFGKAAFIKNVETVDSENNFNPASDLISASEHPKCYQATNGYNGLWEYYVFFGGPGDNKKCT
ncbi:protein neprosin-like [Rutidosis leptorrhynchoides]|uniref:protein neprosin-like n=1 Tax=Rutidosis leptorrhynchoides TaxID=125765 RepID=UPI003A9A3C98